MYPFSQVVHRLSTFTLLSLCALFLVPFNAAHASVLQEIFITAAGSYVYPATGYNGPTVDLNGFPQGGFNGVNYIDGGTGAWPGSMTHAYNINASFGSVCTGNPICTLRDVYFTAPFIGLSGSVPANGLNWFSMEDFAGDVVWFEFYYDSGTGSAGNAPSASCLTGDFGTCINTVDPEDMQVIATTSLPYTFQADGYIKDDDYESGSRLMIKIDNNTQQQQVGALTAFDSAFGNKTYLPISASGSFDVSTSSDNIIIDQALQTIGLYNVHWEVQSPKFSILGFNLLYSSKAQYNSRFVIGTTTAIDNIQLAQEKYLGDLAAGIGDPLAACQFSIFSDALDFSLGGKVLNCMGGLLQWLIVPGPGVLQTIFEQLKTGFLTRPPVGYFTRIVTVISSSTPSTLPTLSASIPTSSDPGENIDISFDLADTVNGAATLQDSFVSPEGHTAREILEPIIKTIVGLLVLMFIYKDIMRTI